MTRGERVLRDTRLGLRVMRTVTEMLLCALKELEDIYEQEQVEAESRYFDETDFGDDEKFPEVSE